MGALVGCEERREEEVCVCGELLASAVRRSWVLLRWSYGAPTL